MYVCPKCAGTLTLRDITYTCSERPVSVNFGNTWQIWMWSLEARIADFTMGSQLATLGQARRAAAASGALEDRPCLLQSTNCFVLLKFILSLSQLCSLGCAAAESCHQIYLCRCPWKAWNFKCETIDSGLLIGICAHREVLCSPRCFSASWRILFYHLMHCRPHFSLPPTLGSIKLIWTGNPHNIINIIT